MDAGYDGGITGGIAVMEPFAREFFPSTLSTPSSNFYCKYNDRLLQTFASMMHFVGAFAAFPAGHCTAKFGRTRQVSLAHEPFQTHSSGRVVRALPTVYNMTLVMAELC